MAPTTPVPPSPASRAPPTGPKALPSGPKGMQRDGIKIPFNPRPNAVAGPSSHPNGFGQRSNGMRGGGHGMGVRQPNGFNAFSSQAQRQGYPQPHQQPHHQIHTSMNGHSAHELSSTLPPPPPPSSKPPSPPPRGRRLSRQSNDDPPPKVKESHSRHRSPSPPRSHTKDRPRSPHRPSRKSVPESSEEASYKAHLLPSKQSSRAPLSFSMPTMSNGELRPVPPHLAGALVLEGNMLSKLPKSAGKKEVTSPEKSRRHGSPDSELEESSHRKRGSTSRSRKDNTSPLRNRNVEYERPESSHRKRQSISKTKKEDTSPVRERSLDSEYPESSYRRQRSSPVVSRRDRSPDSQPRKSTHRKGKEDSSPRTSRRAQSPDPHRPISSSRKESSSPIVSRRGRSRDTHPSKHRSHRDKSYDSYESFTSRTRSRSRERRRHKESPAPHSHSKRRHRRSSSTPPPRKRSPSPSPHSKRYQSPLPHRDRMKNKEGKERRERSRSRNRERRKHSPSSSQRGERKRRSPSPIKEREKSPTPPRAASPSPPPRKPSPPRQKVRVSMQLPTAPSKPSLPAARPFSSLVLGLPPAPDRSVPALLPPPPREPTPPPPKKVISPPPPIVIPPPPPVEPEPEPETTVSPTLSMRPRIIRPKPPPPESDLTPQPPPLHVPPSLPFGQKISIALPSKPPVETKTIQSPMFPTPAQAVPSKPIPAAPSNHFRNFSSLRTEASEKLGKDDRPKSPNRLKVRSPSPLPNSSPAQQSGWSTPDCCKNRAAGSYIITRNQDEKDDEKKEISRRLDGKVDGKFIEISDPRLGQPSRPEKETRFKEITYDWDNAISVGKKPIPPPTAILITQLHPLTTQDQIRRFFSHYGRVRDVKVEVDKRMGSSLGICWLKFDGPANGSRGSNGKPLTAHEVAVGAVKACDGKRIKPDSNESIKVVLDGRGLRTKKAVQEEEDRLYPPKPKPVEFKTVPASAPTLAPISTPISRPASTPMNGSDTPLSISTSTSGEKSRPVPMAVPLSGFVGHQPYGGPSRPSMNAPPKPAYPTHATVIPVRPINPITSQMAPNRPYSAPLMGAPVRPMNHPATRPPDPNTYNRQIQSVQVPHTSWNGYMPMNGHAAPSHSMPSFPPTATRQLASSFTEAPYQPRPRPPSFVPRRPAPVQEVPSSFRDSYVPGGRDTYVPHQDSPPRGRPDYRHDNRRLLSRSRSSSLSSNSDSDSHSRAHRASPPHISARLVEEQEKAKELLALNGFPAAFVTSSLSSTAENEVNLKAHFKRFKPESVHRTSTGFYILFSESDAAQSALFLHGSKLQGEVLNVTVKADHVKARPMDSIPSAVPTAIPGQKKWQLLAIGKKKSAPGPAVVNPRSKPVARKRKDEEEQEQRVPVKRKKAPSYSSSSSSSDLSEAEEEVIVKPKTKSKVKVPRKVVVVESESRSPSPTRVISPVQAKTVKSKPKPAKKTVQVIRSESRSPSPVKFPTPEAAEVHAVSEGEEELDNEMEEEEEEVVPKPKKTRGPGKAKKGKKEEVIEMVEIQEEKEEEPEPVIHNGKKRRGPGKANKKGKKARIESPAPLVETSPPPVPEIAEIKIIPSEKVATTKKAPPPKKAKPKKSPPGPLDALIADDEVIDDEDAYWLNKLTDEVDQPSEEEEEGNEEEVLLPEEHPLYHTSGAWRAQGLRKVPPALKSAYLPQRNRAQAAAEASATSGQGGHGLTTGRTARHAGRRLVNDMETARKITTATAESDLFAFNQLRIRKKQLRFARSAIEGYGLYAMETIQPGEMVCEYVGELIRAVVADVREARYTKQGIGSSYLFRIDGDVVCDATFRGSVSRLINHSCDPSASAKIISINGQSKIVIYAKRLLSPGEEILYNYLFPIETDPALRVPCLCGSKICRGFLN